MIRLMIIHRLDCRLSFLGFIMVLPSAMLMTLTQTLSSHKISRYFLVALTHFQSHLSYAFLLVSIFSVYV